MFEVDSLILVSGVLLLLAIASSKFSARLGVPVLVLFLALGMLLGSEGIGGVAFDNYGLAHAIGTIALAIILFDGGLATSLESIRITWRPSLLLATFGVLITAFVTGVAAAWILEIPLLEGLLLGSIVGSTDAAAVFAVLRSGGVTLPTRLSSTLEIESASNDPMAIFLTIGCIQVLTGKMAFGPALLQLFLTQMLVGAAIGLAVGYAAVWVINRVRLPAAGLYPVLVTAFGFLTFGLAAELGGSGFLAAFITGVVIGNSRLAFKRGILVFHEAGAWFAQIVMFVVLGLLSFPSRLMATGWQGVLITAVLMFVARPVAVLLLLFPLRFNWRDMSFLSWVGLKGAVPITLATFPLLFDVPRAQLLFDVVFFVVVLSALIQGWTLPWAARRLGLELPAPPPAPVTLEITSLRDVEGDIVDYTVEEDSRAAGKRVKDLALPEGVVIAIIARGDQIIPPQGRTLIQPGDHVILVLRPAARALVNRVFARVAAPSDQLPASIEFPLRGSVTVGELEEFYDIRMHVPKSCTLAEAIRQRVGNETVTLDTLVRFGEIKLHVREIDPQGEIVQVGLVISPHDETEPSKPQTQSQQQLRQRDRESKVQQ